MPIITDFFRFLQREEGLAGKIGFDAGNAESRFFLGQALKQIEAAALGYKSKPLEKIREIGFDSIQSLGGVGGDILLNMFATGELERQAQKFAADSQGLYGAHELTYFDPRFFEIEHKPLRFREYFNITRLADPADKQYNYKMERLVGKANWNSESSTTHYRADVIEEDYWVNIKNIEVEFVVTTSDLRAAIKTGRPIEVRKMKAAFRTAEEQMNDAVIIGNDKPALKGFINNSDIVEDIVVDSPSYGGVGDPKLWENKTPEEILIGDIGSEVAAMREATFGLHSPTHMGLSIERYNYLSQRWIQSVMPISLLKWLLDNVGAYGIEKIIPMVELSGAGPGGSNMAIYWDNKGDAIEIDIPMELTWQPPQFHGLEIRFYGEARISDMILRRKRAARRQVGF